MSASRQKRTASQTAGIARLVRDPAAWVRHGEAAAASDKSVVARAMHEIGMLDLRPALAAATVSITVLYTGDGTTTMPAAAFNALFRDAYAGAKTVKLVRVDEARHFIMDDQPTRFAELVDEFLRNGGR